MCESPAEVRIMALPAQKPVLGVWRNNPGLSVFFYKDSPPVPAQLPCFPHSALHLTGRHKSQSLIKLIQGPPRKFDHGIILLFISFFLFLKQIWEQIYQLLMAASHSPVHAVDRWLMEIHTLKVIKHQSSGLLMQQG